jgi:hypothetical protein
MNSGYIDVSNVSVSSTGLSFGDAVAAITNVLEGLSGRDRFRALRAASGVFGHRVLPGNGTQGNSRSVNVPAVGGRPKAPSQPRSSKSAEQKRIDDKIRELNSQIKRKSAANGERLSETDPLIEQRRCLFRAKHGKENGSPTPHCGEGDPNP